MKDGGGAVYGHMVTAMRKRKGRVGGRKQGDDVGWPTLLEEEEEENEEEEEDWYQGGTRYLSSLCQLPSRTTATAALRLQCHLIPSSSSPSPLS